MQLLAQDFPEEMPSVEDYNTEIPLDTVPQAEINYAPLAGMGVGFMIVWAAVVIIGILTMWKIFSKAGKPGWAAIIPLYNIIVLLQIIGRPAWWILLFFVPFANLVISVIMSLDLAKVFNKSTLFGIMLLWFIPVGYFILAFGSAKYTAPTAGPTSSTPSTPASPPPAAPAPEAPTQPTTPAS